jgi:hypothetical protein
MSLNHTGCIPIEYDELTVYDCPLDKNSSKKCRKSIAEYNEFANILKKDKLSWIEFIFASYGAEITIKNISKNCSKS